MADAFHYFACLRHANYGEFYYILMHFFAMSILADASFVFACLRHVNNGKFIYCKTCILTPSQFWRMSFFLHVYVMLLIMANSLNFMHFYAKSILVDAIIVFHVNNMFNSANLYVFYAR